MCKHYLLTWYRLVEYIVALTALCTQPRAFRPGSSLVRALNIFTHASKHTPPWKLLSFCSFFYRCICFCIFDRSCCGNNCVCHSGSEVTPLTGLAQPPPSLQRRLPTCNRPAFIQVGNLHAVAVWKPFILLSHMKVGVFY